MFAALVGQLAYLQILNGSRLTAEVDRTDKTVIKGNVPGWSLTVKVAPL